MKPKILLCFINLLLASPCVITFMARTATADGYQTPMPMPLATPTPMPDMPGMKSGDGSAKKSAPSATPAPTPAPGVQSPTAMPGMKSSDDPAKKTDMSEDGMGAAGLVPTGVMVGMAGRWMVGYQVMLDRLKGNLIGNRRVSEATVLKQFETSPTDMTMQMHMFTVMYTPSRKLTIMAMLPYIKMSMGELHRDGTRSTERSQGIGDLELSSHCLLFTSRHLRHRFLLNTGVGLPTGSINQRDAEGARLEYPMQIGSGTFSFMPGFTYLGQAVPWAWGAEFISTLRIGTNSNGYRIGNRYQTSVWGARQLTPSLRLSAKLNSDISQNIKGADASLDRLDEPTKDTTLQGGRRLDLTFGLSIQPPEGVLRGHSFFVDLDKPILQSLDGPQLQRRWTVRLGWQWEF